MPTVITEFEATGGSIPARTAFDYFNRKPVADLFAKEANPINATLEAVIRKLSALAERVARLERALHVQDDGSVVLAASGSLSLVSDQRVVMSAPQRVQVQCGSNSVAIDATKLAISSASKIDLAAPSVGIGASTVTMSAAMVQASGTFRCDTMIANSVVGSSYTPGAGNIW